MQMIKKLSIVFLLFVFSISISECQGYIAIKGSKFFTTTSFGIISGLNIQKYEFGLGVNFLETRPENDILSKPFGGFSFTIEKYTNSNKLIGQNLDIWINAFFVFGLNQNFHQLEKSKTFGLKPYLGFEICGITFTYGYNFYLNTNKIGELKQNNFMIRYYLPLYKIKK